MFKRIAILALLGVAGLTVAAERSDAGIFYRPIAPVRRVARTVLPPYPVAYRVARPVYGPAVAPVYAPAVYGAPYGYGYGYAPYGYAPYGYGGGGVSVVVGF